MAQGGTQNVPTNSCYYYYLHQPFSSITQNVPTLCQFKFFNLNLKSITVKEKRMVQPTVLPTVKVRIPISARVFEDKL